MPGRPLLMFTAALAALTVSAAPALAGEDDDSAVLHASQGCVHGTRALLAVSGDDIDSVTYYLDGHRLKTVTRPDASGRFAVAMACGRLSAGAHRGRAVVAFDSDSESASKTLRFQITRPRQASARFTG